MIEISTGKERLHALDALRAWALLAGIVLHASLSFFVGMPALDVSQSPSLGLLFYVIHIFRMAMFYVIAGFFAQLSLQRKGSREFFLDRCRRILLPLVAGWLILLPLTGLPVLWGVQRTFGDNPPALIQQAMTALPLLHLWFLYYLLWFYAAFLLWRHLQPALPGVIARLLSRIASAVSHTGAPILLALPCMAALLLRPVWNPWFGIPTPERGLWLEASAVTVYGLAFFIGVAACGKRQILAAWQHQWRGLLLIAVLLTGLSLALAGLKAELFEPRYFEDAPGQRAFYAFFYCAALWYWSFGLIGLALQYCHQYSAVMRYLADASYWLYLAHVPLVFFLQVALMEVPLHWSLKFPLILILAMMPLLYCYDRWIRPGRIGEILNGRRMPGGMPKY